ncbi:MAG TPA: hypothetical protein VHY37_11255 [Tepidisphaeraceae bacterium]|jgi:hypothetical protein|nr:hypothetical protein [Tepidisphaeraceae bacterium]
MSTSLEKRVSALESRIAELCERQSKGEQSDRAWLDDLYGKFANDPFFDQAMALGKKYRRSLRPSAATPKRNS